ncbi:unnamed protein product [Rhizophagus irregularis]|nr:unnamed protein product [Rhizophagus irregularis]
MQTSFVKENENEGFDLNAITPWITSYPDRVFLEESDDNMMYRWIQWLKNNVDVDMMIKQRKVVSCRNGKFSELLRRKWFVQEHQLSNYNEVIHAYNYVGKEQAKRIADSHHPPRDQLAAVHDCGEKFLILQLKELLYFQKQKY